MTHDPFHSLYFAAGAIYFLGATYLSARNYQVTDGDGFWFFAALFSLSMVGVMIAGVLWSSGKVVEVLIHPYHDIFFLIASIMLLAATYTLSKRHHKIRVF